MTLLVLFDILCTNRYLFCTCNNEHSVVGNYYALVVARNFTPIFPEVTRGQHHDDFGITEPSIFESHLLRGRRSCFRVFPSPRHSSKCDAAQQESSWWCDLPPAIHSAHTTPSRYLTTSTNEPNATAINPNFPVGQKSCPQIVHVYINPSSWLLMQTHLKHQIQLHNHTRSRSTDLKTQNSSL
jgi:hypothetical protein